MKSTRQNTNQNKYVLLIFHFISSDPLMFMVDNKTGTAVMQYHCYTTKDVNMQTPYPFFMVHKMQCILLRQY